MLIIFWLRDDTNGVFTEDVRKSTPYGCGRDKYSEKGFRINIDERCGDLL